MLLLPQIHEVVLPATKKEVHIQRMKHSILEIMTDLKLRCIVKSHGTLVKRTKTLDHIKNEKRRVMLYKIPT